VLRLGRTLRCPVPRLLALLGASTDSDTVTDLESSEGEPGSSPIAPALANLQAIGPYRNDHPPAA
jgi:hypothetical protein